MLRQATSSFSLRRTVNSRPSSRACAANWVRNGIEVRREGGGSLFEAPEVIATYHFLRMLIDEGDEVALYEALRTPYLRHLDSQSATVEALTDKKALADWFEGTSCNDLVDRLRLSAIEETVPQTLTRVFEETGLLRAYEAAGMTGGRQTFSGSRNTPVP